MIRFRSFRFEQRHEHHVSMTISVRAFGTLIALSVFAPTLAVAQTPDVVVEGKIQDKQKRVCKQSTTTGSIFAARICKTKAEWEEIRQRSLAQTDQLKDDFDRYRTTQMTRDAMCG